MNGLRQKEEKEEDFERAHAGSQEIWGCIYGCAHSKTSATGEAPRSGNKEKKSLGGKLARQEQGSRRKTKKKHECAETETSCGMPRAEVEVEVEVEIGQREYASPAGGSYRCSINCGACSLDVSACFCS